MEKKEFKVFKDTFLKNILIVTIMTFFIEVIFINISKFELMSYSTLRILISSFILASIINFISNLTKKKVVKNIINVIYVLGYAFYSWLQLGFINYLGVYISFNTSSQLGAVKDYIGDYLASFKPIYFIVYIPVIVIIVYYILIRKWEYNRVFSNKKNLLFIPTFIVSIVLYYLTLTLPFMQNSLQAKTNLGLFKNPDVPTVAVNQFGTTVFGILDFKSFIFPSEEVEEEFIPIIEETKDDTPVSREVSSALEEVANNETNDKYKNLNKYFVSQKVTDYNEYTGLLKDKNVVVILMESVNDAFINEKYFPNFYTCHLFHY